MTTTQHNDCDHLLNSYQNDAMVQQVPLEDDTIVEYPLSSSSSTAVSLGGGGEDDCEILEPIFVSKRKCGSKSLFFQVLFGFTTDPFQTKSSERGKRNTHASDLRLSMLSNFSTAYNVLSISLALKLMENSSDNSDVRGMESLLSASLIGGMIVGQVCLGALGDVLGRHWAMAVVLLLQVVAAFASALAVDYSNILGYRLSLVQVLAACRFILGLGCGGVYPLSATLTSESSANGTDKAKSVALAFSFQGVGYLVVPMVALLLIGLFGESSQWSWRILLGLGSVPGAALTMARLRKAPATAMTVVETVKPVTREVPVSVWDAVMLEKNLFRKLMGTAGAWLLFDILFYGNSLFTPIVLSAAFGESETVSLAARDTMILSLIAIPGYFVAVWAVGKQTPRRIQLQGFTAMGILYCIVGVLFDRIRTDWTLLLSLYGSTFFFSNYGPNTTTFLLPSLTFKKECRSTLNGFSAACGKVGALIGASVFVTASNQFGLEFVFLCCSALSFVGVVITACCVRIPSDKEADEDPSASGLSKAEEEEIRLLRESLPVKLVYSHPSIFDWNEGA